MNGQYCETIGEIIDFLSQFNRDDKVYSLTMNNNSYKHPSIMLEDIKVKEIIENNKIFLKKCIDNDELGEDYKEISITFW